MRVRKVHREIPGAGQESVWDYPRPPAVEASGERIRIELGGALVADTTDALRVLETSHPPVYYLPPEAFLVPVHEAGGLSMCEFKGMAHYLTIAAGDRIAVRSAWTYPEPWPGYESLAGRIAVYPSRMDRCLVDGEAVAAQEGDFYGGWITSRVVGPFKGAPGTLGW
ncbi:DUF427 domain-containing protein [Amnibacterium kyonggiense]